MRKALTACLLILAACTTIKYQDDLGYLNSAQAENPEFPVYINGVLCKDTENLPGLCSKRIGSTTSLKITMPPRPYSYKLDLACSRELGESQTFDIEKNQGFSHEIKPDKFSKLKSFICIGEVFPKDRPEEISSLWEVRVKIADRAYKPRESMYLTKRAGHTFIVLGEYARDAWVHDEGKWSHYDKATTVEIKGDPTKVLAYSESYKMRFNSYGFDGEAPEGSPFHLSRDPEQGRNDDEIAQSEAL